MTHTRSASYHGFVDGVCGIMREDAAGEAGHHLDHPHLMGCLQYVVVYVEVVPLKHTDGQIHWHYSPQVTSSLSIIYLGRNQNQSGLVSCHHDTAWLLPNSPGWPS